MVLPLDVPDPEMAKPHGLNPFDRAGTTVKRVFYLEIFMSDSYQAIYDAVRSRIVGADIGSAIESAIREMNISHCVSVALSGIHSAAASHEEPSAIYRPKLFIDGNVWCALYGEDPQNGVAGFGKSPSLAMQDFNKNWYANLPAPASCGDAE